MSVFDKYMREKSGGTHAKLSASGAERWLNCPGSVRLSEGLPDEDNEHSIKGTRVHTLLQFMLENADWRELLKTPEARKFKEWNAYDVEQQRCAEYAYYAVFNLWRRGEQIFSEQKLEVPSVGFGTSDVLIYQPFGHLHVIDYKNGKTVVEPEENVQGLYYAVGAAEKFGWDFGRVDITIIQPNAPHPRGLIRTWTTTRRRLEQAHSELKVGALRTKEQGASLVANKKWCWYCKARNICPAYGKSRAKNVRERFKRKGQNA